MLAGYLFEARASIVIILFLLAASVSGENSVDSCWNQIEPGLINRQEKCIGDSAIASFYPAKEEINPRKFDDRKHNWLFIVLVLQLVLIAYLRISFSKYFEDLFNGFANISIAQQLAREQELSLPISSVLLNLNFVLSISIYGYLLVNHYDLTTSPDQLTGTHQLQFFLLITLCIAILYLSKYLTLKLVGAIFPVGEEMDDYSFNFFMILKIAGLVLIPFNYLVAYSPPYLSGSFMFLSGFAIFLLIIFRTLKGLVIGKNYYLTDKFHFFLYICTLEIAPILIIVKLLSTWL